MKLFKSKEPNTFHYITAVAHNRLPIFRKDETCQIFVDNLIEIKEKHPFKLIGYVIMPNHVHLIVNPLECNISIILMKLKGKCAKQIIDWLKEKNYSSSLKKLAINIKGREYAVWQKDSSAIDLFSHKFLRQKLNYIHLNPVRAGLCENPAEWKWSSYRAYLPHKQGEVPVEMDLQAYWKEADFENLEVGGQARL
jgi:putative transposase